MQIAAARISPPAAVVDDPCAAAVDVLTKLLARQMVYSMRKHCSSRLQTVTGWLQQVSAAFGCLGAQQKRTARAGAARIAVRSSKNPRRAAAFARTQEPADFAGILGVAALARREAAATSAIAADAAPFAVAAKIEIAAAARNAADVPSAAGRPFAVAVVDVPFAAADQV